MKRQFSQYLLVIFLLAFSTAGMTVEKASWDDLSPEMELSRDQIAPTESRVSKIHKHRVDLYYLRKLVRERGTEQESEEMSALEKRSIASLEAGGFDAREIIREMTRLQQLRKENDSKLVEALNGKRIQIAGYLLPIEFSGDKVVEFLLVAEDGACVHDPVPPLNQLIYVTSDEAFKIEGLFTPVVVSGVISTSSSRQSIAYSDGVLDIVAGYNLVASRVEAYPN
jgi:hypothetical protein